MLYFCSLKGVVPGRLLLLFATVVGLGLLGGCDSAGDASSSNSAEEDQQTNTDEVVIESKSFTEANLQFRPSSISPEKTFSIVLPGENPSQGEPRITHNKVGENKHELQARFDPLDVESISVECRNENTGHTQKMATMDASELDAKASSTVRCCVSDEWPTSFHIGIGEHNYTWSVDYGGVTDPGTMVDFPNSDEPMECTHVSFKMEDVDDPFEASGIRFEGVDQAPTFHHREFK